VAHLPVRAAEVLDAGPPAPAALSETGLFETGASGAYADDVLSFSVRYPLWTDGADKRRHLRLPEGTSIDTSDPDQWAFPVGTRLYKEFVVDGVPVETRLLWKTGPGPLDWVYVAYLYRDDGSEADAVPDGQPDARGTDHDVPPTADCRSCHLGGGDFVLGLGAFQLDRATYDAWIASGALPPGTAWQEPPGDDTQREALGYLHGNCGHCHGGPHPIAERRSLRLRLPVGVSDPYEAPAWATAANVTAFHDIEGTTEIIAVGDPDASQLYVRMGLRGDLGMPPFGTEIADEAARAVIRDWITAAAP